MLHTLSTKNIYHSVSAFQHLLIDGDLHASALPDLQLLAAPAAVDCLSHLDVDGRLALDLQQDLISD
jgi:hypothetical protein